MGMNSYLFRKINYNSGVPTQLGCDDFGESDVRELSNGYVWNNTYYSTIDELNNVLYQKIHIGKSSYGWHYSLAIYPEYGINNFDDWKKLFLSEDTYIMNEYNEVQSSDEMIDIITNRKQRAIEEYDSVEDYERETIRQHNDMYLKYNFGRHVNSYDDLLKENHAVRGLNGLWRHMPDKYTMNTEGTYDYLISGNDANNCIIFS